ncbi:MAG: 1-(5-phosphoribosyl)-5-[(5-phosphoribosylamino)methylideneamino]imidazole-4-carboxamide isomerase [Nitrospira sp.]|nr:1-(5-phosphoribosyl)-5-[(5-phosphoribosylamino)methylideneamino]imidazole-4-carboxamide isomerase [Nitrospira sp.]
MMIIPAIDIKDGRCVRLSQGKMQDETVYSDAPEQVAKRWEKQGAKLLHVVDLDGAVQGTPKNFELIKKILKTVKIQVQVGGGIRDIAGIEAYLAANASCVVLGTTAVLDLQGLREACRRFPKKIVVAIDSHQGRVAIRGWQEVSDQLATDLARKIEDLPIAGLLVTDIQRDGMLTGPNLNVLQVMVNATRIPVIASGGVRSIEDIKNLLKIKGLYGVIIGKALYEGFLNLEEAISLAKVTN